MKPWVRLAICSSLRWPFVVVLFLLLRPGTTPVERRRSHDAVDARAVRRATSASSSPSRRPRHRAPRPQRTSIEVTYRNGAVRGPTVFTAAQGERVRILVRADVSDDVHLHGYDLMADVDPRRARGRLRANAAGVFEVRARGRRRAVVPSGDRALTRGGRPLAGSRRRGPLTAAPAFAHGFGGQTGPSGPALALRLRRRHRADRLVRRPLGALDGTSVRRASDPHRPPVVGPVDPDQPRARVDDPAS